MFIPFKYLLITAFLLATSLHTLAQADTLYFDDDWKRTDWSYATKYRIYRLDSAYTGPGKQYKIKEHSITRNRLKCTGTYLYVTEFLKNGVFTYFDKAGNVTSIDIYDHDKPVGDWTMFYEGSKNIWAVEKYQHDTVTEVTSYYPCGKLKRSQKGGRVHPYGKCYNEDGTEMPFTAFEIMPEPTFSMPQFLQKNLNYPEVALERNIQGRVKVSFLVDTNGYIKDVSIKEPVNDVLKMEAMRVVSKMPNWKPALQDGRRVPVHFTLPIVFQTN